MRKDLLPLLRCPLTGDPLELTAPDASWIETGELIHRQDGRSYAIKRGMPYLFIEDESWQPKAREAQGWVAYHKDRNIYDQTGSDLDFQLPYFPHEPWTDVARQFDIALDLIKPQPGQWVLDVGAGRGWAAKHFALRGCNAVALDIVDDDQVGLGRARALMEQANVVFDTMIADTERLPFAADCFDIVFCAAALHHTTDLGQLIANISRVLRPGGRLVAINEPCIPDDTDDEELRRTALAEELAYGINETRPRLRDYRSVLRVAGLKEQVLVTPESYPLSLEDMEAWSQGLQILPPSALESTNRLSDRLLRLFGRPQKALRERWIEYLLKERGGSMIMVATKG